MRAPAHFPVSTGGNPTACYNAHSTIRSTRAIQEGAVGMKVLLSLGGLVVCANALWAQAPAPAGRVIGEVTEVDAGRHEIAMKSDKGDAVKVTLAGKTLFLQVPPGETDLKKAIRTSLYDIAAGDRVLARGAVSEDGKSVAATAIIVMSKTDLAQMHQRRREEGQKGVAGV